nr:chromosome partitioning protein ParB [Acidimicrobiia bacterium]
LSAGHARALLASPDRSYQEALANRAVREGLSVRAVEEAVRLRADPTGRTGRIRADAPRSAGMDDLETLLAEHLETRVRVEEAGKRSRIVVEFADLDDLERIYRAMVEGSGTAGDPLSPAVVNPGEA